MPDPNQPTDTDALLSEADELLEGWDSLDYIPDGTDLIRRLCAALAAERLEKDRRGAELMEVHNVLAEARADTERLDFMEHAAGFVQRLRTGWYFEGMDGESDERQDTLRATLDHAREASE